MRNLAILILLLSTAASADKFPVEITNQKVLDKLPALCAFLRSTLPLEKQNPWDASICMTRFALNGIKDQHFKNVTRVQREIYKQEMDDAKEVFVDTPAVGIGTP